jgi:hypothetical protein
VSLYTVQTLPIRPGINASHQQAIDAYAAPGTWFDATTRIAILKESRSAHTCQLCHERKQALSPYSVSGEHSTATPLAPDIVDVIHRLKTDSGRMTQSWLNKTIESGLSREEYIEIVGLVSTSIILDSFAKGLGVDLLEPPAPVAGEPTRELNPGVFDGGAWVPLLVVEQTPTDVELPSSPNIFRAMGLVPGAIGHFFGVMRAHYALADLDFDITRSQTELIAARVSSLNQCFY